MAGVHADLGEDPPVLQVGEAVLVRRALAADQLVRLLLGLGQRMAPGRLAAGGRPLPETDLTSTQGSMIRRYIIWRNKHASDRRLSALVARENVA